VILMISRYHYWQNERGVIDNDIVSYYGYLPSLFIYHDVTLNFAKDYKGPLHFKFWPVTAPNGGYYHKTTLGVAYCYAPFFLGANAYAHWFHYETGGYSRPYEVGLLISALFFFCIGLFYLRKILLLFFNDLITAIVILLTVFGTNFFYYITLEAVMSHSYSFTLISVFIYYSIKWQQSQKYSIALLLGISLGWMVIIRPNNLLIVLFLFLYDVKNSKEFFARIRLLLSNYKQFLMIGIIMILFWIPQFIYWKTVTGEWFFFSYVDERFFFLKPHILEGLFGFRKGWFIYTPLMIFAMAGLLMTIKKLKQIALPVLIFMPLHIWIVFSWWCWWYGGGLSQRSMVDIYALLAIPLGIFINWLWQQKFPVKIPVTLVMLCLFLLTSFYNIQYHYGGLNYHGMTKDAYFENFGHWEPHGNFVNYLQCPDYEKAKQGIQATEPCH